MDQLLSKLEAVTLKIAAGAAVAEGEMSPAVQAWFDFYSASVQPFIDACNKVEGTKKLGTWTETSFKHIGKVLQASQDCAKPDQAKFLKFLDPVVKIINDSGNCDNRSPSFPQEKAYNEIIQSLSWVMMDGGKAFILGQLEAADFYLNKVLTAAKDKPDAEKQAMRDYVKYVKEMIKAMADYSHDFHKTGIMWKFQGADILTWKPGQAPAKPAGGKAATPEDRLGNCIQKLEAYAATLGGEDEEGTPIKVAEYNEYYSTHVQPFIDACNAMESTKKLGAYAETCFKHLGEIIKATYACKKPAPEAFMKFLSPIVKVIEACGNPDKRGAAFNEEKSFSEAIQSMNWVCMDNLPRAFVASQADGAEFYLNKVLTAAKDKPDAEKNAMRKYVATIKTCIKELADYVGKHWKTGLEWNNKDGKDISSIAVAASAAPVEEKKEAPKKKAFAFKPKAPAKKEGSIDTSKQDKIFIEHYGKEQKEPVVVKIPPQPTPKTGVFIGQCSDCVIKIEGKAKNITVSGCNAAGIVFDECVTTLEAINSKRCQVQALKTCGTFTLDKCDRMKVYLPDASYAAGALVFTTQSSATNIYYPTDDGEDMVEYGVPEQILSHFSTGKDVKTEVIIPDAE